MGPRPVCFVMLLAGLTAACGKKGAPLAPLYLVPAAVGEISARRVEDSVRLRFVLPATNQNGPGIDLDRVEIFAVTLPPGEEPPPNRDLLTKPYLAGRMTVKPPAAEGAAPSTDDTRPAPGDTVTFVEQLSTLSPAPARAGRTAVPAAPSTAGDPARPDRQVATPPLTEGIKIAHPVRVYVIRGVARNGRSGAPSARVSVSLGALPEPPGGVSARNTEKAIIVEWLPAVAALGSPAPAYNVYRADAPEEPLNPKPLTTTTLEHIGAELGGELCVRVRSVDAVESVFVEGVLSAPACIARADVFPPAAPKGLAAVSTPGAVQLIWDASSEPDLAGYLVLRAEAPDETLQPLTPAPIRDTVYRDAAVKPGARYAYAIVAVDAATPPNRSAPSERVDAIAR